MSDLISRQAAIDALENDKAALDKIIKGMSAMDVRLDAYVSQRNQVVYDIDAIEQLPPIQPVNCSEFPNNSDAISRQAAIEAFNTNLNELVVGGEKNAKTVENYLNGVLDKIKCLPPAEPKRGKWVEGNHASYWKCSECGEITTQSVMGKPRANFCPNCGAKMEVTNG